MTMMISHRQSFVRGNLDLIVTPEDTCSPWDKSLAETPSARWARSKVKASRHSPRSAMKTTSAATKYSPNQAAATQATARAISAPIEP